MGQQLRLAETIGACRELSEKHSFLECGADIPLVPPVNRHGSGPSKGDGQEDIECFVGRRAPAIPNKDICVVFPSNLYNLGYLGGERVFGVRPTGKQSVIGPFPQQIQTITLLLLAFSPSAAPPPQTATKRQTRREHEPVGSTDGNTPSPPMGDTASGL